MVAASYGTLADGKRLGSRRVLLRLRAVVDEIGCLADKFSCCRPKQLVHKLNAILDSIKAHGWKESVARFG